MKIKTLCLFSLLLTLCGGVWAQRSLNHNGQLRNREVVTLPYSYGFEDEDEFENWTTTDLNSQSRRYENGYLNASARTGDFGFMFYTYDAEIQYLVSPMMSGTDEAPLEVHFWYMNHDVEFAEAFQVGYSTTGNDVEDFIWDDDIVADENDWQEYEESFPIGTKYIAVRGLPGENALLLDDFEFSVYEGLVRPTVPTAEVIVNTVNLTWTGNSDSYEVRYGKYYSYGFEEGLDGWTAVDYDGDGFNWTWGEANNPYFAHNSEHMMYSLSWDDGIGAGGLDPDNYLVSPLVTLGGSISFYAVGNDLWYYDEHFGVAVSTGESFDVNEDDFPIVEEFDALYQWVKYTVDLSEYEGVGHLAIRHFESAERSCLSLDDISIKGPATTIANNEGASCTLENLAPGTYFVEVKGLSDNKFNEWSPAGFFTINDYDTFIADGNWGENQNWQSGTVPEVGSDVVIAAEATIPANYVANAGGVIVQSEGSITIEDGGQLIHNNTGVEVTMKKGITGYVNPLGDDHYYLLGFPNESSLSPTMVTNMMPDGNEFNYDFYYFDQLEDKEWLNYKDSYANMDNFWFYPTKGYLYARSQSALLSATFELIPSEEDFESSLEYEGEGEFVGWNLVANPFACDAYIGRAFYRINETPSGSELVTASGAIAPLEAVFVKADDENDNSITFSRDEVEGTDYAFLNVNVNHQSSWVDRALVRFDGGRGLEKFQLNPTHTKIYFPQDGKNYAVINATKVGEIPVNFMAEENGIYTINVESENVEMTYLHLIDNMTGADVDLLAVPSYSFEAQTTDYASRFRLVFSASSTSSESAEAFAYFNGSEWNVSNIGEATLQVIDMLGRIVSSETIDGNATMNAANLGAGVYVMRLVNGENVKTQKVVVK